LLIIKLFIYHIHSHNFIIDVVVVVAVVDRLVGVVEVVGVLFLLVKPIYFIKVKPYFQYTQDAHQFSLTLIQHEKPFFFI
jgi:hypothetical protein